MKHLNRLCFQLFVLLYLVAALVPTSASAWGREGHELAYFSPSWKAFQADRGRDFSVIVDAVSAGSWTMGVVRK